MSMISEQVKGLRMAAVYKEHSLKMLLEKAADTIEALSANLETANKELERWHTDKINDKIKNPFAWTSTLCCHNCDHKDEYIEELEAANMELSAEDCGGGWITDKAPKESGNYFITTDTVVMGEVDSGVAYWDGESWNTFANIYAWKPIKFPEPYLPEPYREP